MSSSTSSSSKKWVDFFTEAGIPSKYAAKYAVTFNEHRIQKDMLKDLNKDILHEMGIRTMGDVIAIMRHAREVEEEETRSKLLGPSRSSTPDSSANNHQPKIIDRRSGKVTPQDVSNSEVIRRSLAGAKKAVAVAKVKQDEILSSTSSTTGLSTSLARRLGPPEKRAGTVTATLPIRQRMVTGLDTMLPTITTGAATARVIRIAPTTASNSNVFARLGNSSKEKVTATVKPTTIIRRTVGSTSSAREVAAPYTIHDRLGNKSNGGDARRSLDIVRQQPKVVSLKKSIFDRLN